MRSRRSRCRASRAPTRGTSRRGAARLSRRGRSRGRRAGSGTAGTSSHDGSSPVHGVGADSAVGEDAGEELRRVELGVGAVHVEGAQVLHRRGDPLDEDAVVAGPEAGHRPARAAASSHAAARSGTPSGRGAAVVAVVEVAGRSRRRGPSSRSRAASPRGRCSRRTRCGLVRSASPRRSPTGRRTRSEALARLADDLARPSSCVMPGHVDEAEIADPPVDLVAGEVRFRVRLPLDADVVGEPSCADEVGGPGGRGVRHGAGDHRRRRAGVAERVGHADAVEERLRAVRRDEDRVQCRSSSRRGGRVLRVGR